MPSPLPHNRLLHLQFSPSVNARPCSSPLVFPAKAEKFFLCRRCFTQDSPTTNSPSLVFNRLGSVVFATPLGSGGFGSVYKAIYRGTTVAVKQVKKSSKNSLASRQSFWAELNVAHLEHNNVVRIVAASTCAPASQDTLGTIIMEYVGNSTLHHVIYGTDCKTEKSKDDGLGCGHGFLSITEALGYSCDIVAGLIFLHSQMIVHLDLKPANVFITEQNICKLGDFGCSQKLQDPESSPLLSQQGGTYTHRAPELLKGERVTPKADIYSFAVTLWQMVTQQEPYLGERQYVLYSVVARNLRPSLTAAVFKGSATGQQLEMLIESCWKSDVAKRPSAELLLQNIHSVSKSVK